ncbi:MAG: TadE family type IV pilus minor pilin [Gordonia sp. (in: high G+C Gram-positive bacteria)]
MWRRLVADDAGMVTVEAAYALAGIAAFLVLGVGVLGGVSSHIRCTDAAREVARLAAAGEPSPTGAGARIAPAGARFDVRTTGSEVAVSAVCGVPVLPGVTMSARAVAAREPEADDAASGG